MGNDGENSGATPAAVKKEWKGKNSKFASTVKPSRFEGETEEMKGHVYNCSGPQDADLFVKTSKKMSGHVG